MEKGGISMMAQIGYMPMPAGFKYRDVFLRGKPRHERMDSFSIRHPPMDCHRRAKLFQSFDALRGFREAVSSKEVTYVERRQLTEEEMERLNERLLRLHQLTRNGQAARENQVQISLTFFVPCQDEENEAYGSRGQYQQIQGICHKVDLLVGRTILIGEQVVRLSDVVGIEGEIFS